MRKSFLFFILCLALLIPSGAFAAVTENDFSLELVPENPDAYQQVSAQVQSFAVDVNDLSISWKYNGKTIASGKGEKMIQVQAGKAGSAQVLEALIRVDNSTVITKTAVIAPSNTEVLWEALDAYAPSFYKGKPLPSMEGIVRATAFPSVGAMAKKYSYTWSEEGMVRERNSGYGKNSFIFQGTYLDTEKTIGVVVRQGNITAGIGSAQFAFAQPFINFYRKVGNFIDYTQSVNAGYTMQEEVETIVAEPHNISAGRSLERDTIFSWKLGGETAQSGDQVNELVISRGGTSGSTQVESSAKNPKRIMQFTERSFRLNF